MSSDPIKAESLPLPKSGGSQKTAWLALAMLAGITVALINFIGYLKETSLVFPDPAFWYNSFFVVTGHNEPMGLYVVLIFCVILALAWRKSGPFFSLPAALPRITPRNCILALVIFHFLVALLGTWFVKHSHPLACDEFMPNFQASIFLSGQTRAPIPEDLQPIARLLAPNLTARTPDNSQWNSAYLPIYSFLRMPFYAVGLQFLLNPFLGVVAILTMAGIIQIVWPDRPWLAVLGAALVALSPQILATNMSVYAMPAHLALNLVWLWLFLQPEKKRFWLAPVIGFLAIGLHNPFVHALFVAPFLLRIVVDRRWKAVFIFGATYLIAIVVFFQWWKLFAPMNVGLGEPLLSWHGKRIFYTQPLNISNLITWNALPCAFLVFLGVRYYKRMPTIIRDGFFGVVLTFTFYALISIDQSYGWGNRYLYGILGSLLLFAVAGFQEWSKISTDHKPWNLAAVGLGLTFLVLIPVRLWQVETFTRPFSVAEKALKSKEVDLVLLDSRLAWNSSDLIRNDPFLKQRPLIANQRYLTKDQLPLIKERFAKIHIVTAEELTGYGLYTKKWQGEKGW